MSVESLNITTNKKAYSSATIEEFTTVEEYNLTYDYSKP